MLFGIIIYWGWQEVKYAFEIGFFSALLTGPVGFFVAIVLGIVYVAIMGAIKAIINVPKLIYRYSKDYQAIKDAEEYILNLNQQKKYCIIILHKMGQRSDSLSQNHIKNNTTN